VKEHRFLRILSILAAFVLLNSSTIPSAATSGQATGNFSQTTEFLHHADGTTVIEVPAEVADLQTAINTVSNGGVIELAAGTYTAPAGGFLISNIGKSFTIRAVSGAAVLLDGGGTRNILVYMNSSLSTGTTVVFEGITFVNGYSATKDTAAGVTMRYAQSTFINCQFVNNRAVASGGNAGGIAVVENSTAFFFDSWWTGNSSMTFGGGMEVSVSSKVYIHQGRFLYNITNPQGHSISAAGGGIHVVNSLLRVSNSFFEGNQAGYVGGGIYAIGTWNGTPTIPQTDVLVANSTFINNQALRNGVTASNPTEGGAFHLEDQAVAKIFNSRFINNSADAGGGVNLYRSNVAVEGSVFQGNRAMGTVSGSGFGGAVAVSSNDGNDSTTDYGKINRPSAHLEVRNSLFQGRFANVTTVGQIGGGIYAAGDLYRMFGLNGVPKMGTLAENRAVVVVEDSVFNDLDVVENAGAVGSGAGGAIEIGLVDLTLNNSLLMKSDAIGAGESYGGGLAVLDQSIAKVNTATFTHDSSQKYGGVIMAQGSELDLSNCNVFENPNTTQWGPVLFASPYSYRNIPATGLVQACKFSNNNLPAILDDDLTNGPINSMQYMNNQFYSSSGTNAGVYWDPLAGSAKSAAGLNDLVVNRNNGTQTDKGSGNTALTSAPKLGAILAVPPQILSTNAIGETDLPTLAYLGYAWSGGSATLDGQSVTGNTGVSIAGKGTHTLSVGGTNFTASITQAPAPAATFTISGHAPSTLSWSVTSGSFLDVAIDHGVEVPSVSCGSIQVNPSVDLDYWLYVITEEGGFVKSINTAMPILSVPTTFNVLAGKNYSVNSSSILIKNIGSNTLQWTATSSSPNLIVLNKTSGQTQTQDILPFTLNVSSLSPGNYSGTILIDAGAGGSAVVTVNVKLVSNLRKLFLPLTMR